MATLDEITKEKQRLGEALARVDAQREKLTSQLGRAAKTAADRTPATATKAAAPARGRGRRPTATVKPAGGKHGSSNLSDRVLALAIGKTQQEIAAACKGARPNHVGAALSRHKRAGRIEERDGKLYATHSTGAEQHATA